MSVDVSGEITAIATVALAIFAFATAGFALFAWLGQRKEISDQAKMLQVQSEQLDDQRNINAEQTKVLQLQAGELRDSLDQRRIAQAARVFISQDHNPYIAFPKPPDLEEVVNYQLLDPGEAPYPSIGGEQTGIYATVTVVNASDYPIYDTELRWYRGSASHGDPEPLGVIMPGTQKASGRVFPLVTNMAVSGATLRFRDAAGANWIRRLDGGLVEQK